MKDETKENLIYIIAMIIIAILLKLTYKVL